MLLGKPLQHVRRSRIAGFRLFPAGKSHLLKQNFAKLFRGINVKLRSGLLVYFFLEFSDSSHKSLAVQLKLLGFYQNPFLFHVVKHIGKRHFNLLHKGKHSRLRKLFFQSRRRRHAHIGEITGVFRKLLRIILKGFRQSRLSETLGTLRNHQPQIFACDVRKGIIIFQRIKKIGRQNHIKKSFRLIAIQIIISVFNISAGQLPLSGEPGHFFFQIPFRHKAFTGNKATLSLRQGKGYPGKIILCLFVPENGNADIFS